MSSRRHPRVPSSTGAWAGRRRDGSGVTGRYRRAVASGRRWFRFARIGLAVAALAASSGGCRAESDDRTGEAAATPTTSTSTTVVAPTTTTAPPTTTTAAGPGLTRPDWLGTRLLPVRADGFGQVLPTPPELVDRRVPTIDLLPPPPDGRFAATVVPVPDDVVARSSWQASCPVALADLRYVTVGFWGFDERQHTGELIVNARFADDLVEVFRQLFDARFPIEEMRVIRADEIDAPPTGDGNVTTSLVCRPAVGSGSWSRHAYGLAVDINPFHNPYERGDLVLPELASAYLARDNHRPGMIQPGDAVVEAFDAMGWGWGGRWNTLLDYMHFSDNGR